MEPKTEKSATMSSYKENTQLWGRGWAGLHHQMHQQENMNK
jgi:hypothetical protein